MCTYFILKSVMNNPTSYLTYPERKRRFLCYTLIYLGTLLFMGFIFLVAYLQRQTETQLIVLMGICFVYTVIQAIIAVTVYQKDDFQWNNGVIVIDNTMGPQYPLGRAYYPHPYPAVPYLADYPTYDYPPSQYYSNVVPNYGTSTYPSAAPLPPKKPGENPMKILANKTNQKPGENPMNILANNQRPSQNPMKMLADRNSQL